MSFLETLISWDKELFLSLNGIHHPMVDVLMFYISKMWIWIPLYLGVIYFIVRKWKMEAIWIILSIVICVVLTDQLTNLTKEIFQRLRPSHEPDLQGLVHHVNGYVGGRFGFVSGHSSNVFGFALLSSLIIKNMYYTWSIFTWATIVAYSRIYLGVHYPLDIFGGMVLGIGIATIVYLIMDKFRKKLIAEIKSRFF
jgi:undecaprenyl-diphosphatase